MPKPFSVERGFEISIGLLVAGAAIILLSVVGSLGNAGLEDVVLLFMIAGVLFLLIGVLWLTSFLRRINRFHSLLNENSKAVFIKNLDNVEYLAWRLPMRYENELVEKKKEMDLK
jgi:hypothetical protein